MRIHTQSKPYKCPHCKYQCNTLDNLHKHINKAKLHKGYSIYNCKFCTFNTNINIDIISHLYSSHDVLNINTGNLSEYMGLYQKVLDKTELSEGQCARMIP